MYAIARTPTGSAPSSAKKSGEWLAGAFAGSCPSGTIPRKKNIPGTCCW